MTDISKCASGCSRQLLCYRWTAPSHEYRQSYAEFQPDPKTGLCGDYLANAVALAKDDIAADDNHLKNHNQD